MDVLYQYLGAVNQSSFSDTVLTVMKVIIQKRTYYADDIFTQQEGGRIKFRKSGIAEEISKAHQKMFVISVFFLKTFLPEIFCQPEQHLAEFIVSSQARL